MEPACLERTQTTSPKHNDHQDHVQWHSGSVVEHEQHLVLGFSLTDDLGLVEYNSYHHHELLLLIMMKMVIFYLVGKNI